MTSVPAMTHPGEISPERAEEILVGVIEEISRPILARLAVPGEVRASGPQRRPEARATSLG